MLTGQKTFIKEKCSKVDSDNFFGLILNEFLGRIDPEEILNQGKERYGGQGWRNREYYIKKLREKEMENIPPVRFLNSISIHKACPKFVPHINPIALVYNGKGSDLLTETTEAYFVSRYIQGETLMESLKYLKESQKALVYTRLRFFIEELSLQGIYLLDFAPRDIVLRPESNGFEPIVVDTENVLYGDPRDKQMTNRQIEQCRKDYSVFLDEQEVSRLEKELFFE